MLAHAPRRPAHRVMYLIPSMLTLGSVLCGWYVILTSVKGLQDISNPERAADLFNQASQAIGVAIILDNLDGRIARMIGATSLFGVELDSIADALTFGGAAAVLAYAWGFSSMPDLAGMAFVVTFLFVTCGALRLARSNLRARAQHAGAASTQPAETSRAPEDRSFVGLPIPAAAGMIAAMVHFSSAPIGGGPVGSVAGAVDARFYGLVVMAVTMLLSLLMVSTFPYSKLKIRARGSKALGVLNRLVFPSIALLIAAGVWLNSRWVVLILAALYVVHGPLLRLARLFKG